MSAWSPLTLSSRVARNPEHVFGELDQKVVLLLYERGTYYKINEVGSRIWVLLERPRTVSELVGELVNEFEVERATCEKETLTFVEKLCRDGVLTVETA